MAHVTLHDVLAPNRNLCGALPSDATATFLAGDKSPTKSMLPLLVKSYGKLKKQMVAKHGQTLTIQQFIDEFPMLAESIEWNICDNGLCHFSDGLMNTKEGLQFPVMCVLDLQDYWRSNPTVVQNIKNIIDGWRNSNFNPNTGSPEIYSVQATMGAIHVSHEPYGITLENLIFKHKFKVDSIPWKTINLFAPSDMIVQEGENNHDIAQNLLVKAR